MRHYSKMHVLVVAALLLCSVACSSACQEFCTCENGEVQCRSAELTSIPEGLGDDTVVLDVSHNNITIISGKDFESMPNLNKIIIRDSGIEKIEPETFNALQKLEVLDLHRNSIKSLHPSVFQYNLVILDLSDNLLERFECDPNLKLKSLNISGNKLTHESIPSFLSFTSLETLDLSHNQISNLSGAVINAMAMLTHLDISGNPLEYDCDLKTLWTLCRNRSINCIKDDEQSWKMLENLNCGDDEQMTEEDATTPEVEGFLDVGNSVVGSEIAGNDDEGGSGIGDPGTIATDPTLGDITDEPALMEEVNWIMIVIIVCAVIVVVLVIVVIVICIVRRRKSNTETTGNISHAHSIQYLNQHDEFNPSYKNSRSNSVKRTDGSKLRNNNFDRVLNPRDYSKSESNREVIPLGDYTSAEIVRVPSFKTQGIAAPLNLPEEVAYPSHSLPRSSPVSSYEDNTLRAGSLRRYATPEQGTVPDIQIVPPVRRVPSNKRR